MTAVDTSRLADSERPLCEVHDAVFLDLDGVVYLGSDPIPRAADVLNSLGLPLAYLTNNATRTAAQVANHLRSFGLALEDAAVVTSGQVVSDQIVHDLGAGVRVLLAGAEGMREALLDAGLHVVETADDQPAAVVQGGVDDVRWSQLAEASYAVAAGVPWYASNPDLTFPTRRGLAPGNGALVHAVRLATGAEPVVAGKPGRPIFEAAQRRLNVTAPIMVGDRVDTDIDGAIGVGISSLLVLTGVTQLAEVFAIPAGHRPSYVGADLSVLRESQPGVVVEGATATCGGVTARVRDGVIDVDGSRGDIRALRAAVQLAWATRDASDVIATPGGTLET